MPFGFNFGGSKSKTTSNTTTTATAKKMDEASKAVLDQLTQSLQLQLPGAGSQFSRENAITDANAIVRNIFSDFSQQALPQIAMGMQGAGVYNATAGQNLANSAFGEATNKAAQAVLGNVMQYANLQNQQQGLTLNGLLQALQLQRDAFATTTENSSGTSSTSGRAFNLSGSSK